MKPQHTLEQAQERAALYSLGAMAPEEAREFTVHLEDGCEACAQELAAFTHIVDELAVAAEPAKPSDSLRARVLERMTPARFEQDGVSFVRGNRLDWERTPVRQVDRKPLFLDSKRGYRTQLIRIEPGGVYPSHRHADIEEIYIIEGNLSVGGVTMYAGDYCRAEIDSVHEGVTSKDGCVFLALASANNEFLR